MLAFFVFACLITAVLWAAVCTAAGEHEVERRTAQYPLSSKQVNDTHGHAAGDEVLKSMAGRLRECVREADTVARLGVDEFVVVLESISPAEMASSLAEKVVSTASRPVQLQPGPGTVALSVSVGVSCFPTHGVDVDDLMKQADSAMYAAKAAGRNCWRMAAS